MIFQVVHDCMNPECDGRVRLSKSDKNIGARVDHIFEAADSGDVLAHSCITNPYISIQVRKSLRSASLFFPTHVLSFPNLQHICL